MQCLSFKYAIIVAAGQGKRMQSAVPKQFLLINGKPLLLLTLKNILEIDPDIHLILVLPQAHIPLWHKLTAEHNFFTPLTIVEGGRERFDSVRRGLEFVEPHSVVAIHDGVRPFVSKNVWKTCFLTAESKGNAVPVLTATDSVRFLENEISKPMQRNSILLVQTPQCFQADLIKKAYEQDYKPSFTDDIQVFESFYNTKINLIAGNAENIKITTPFDMQFAEYLLFK